MVLYDQVPKDICEKGKMLLHGTGSSLWYAFYQVSSGNCFMFLKIIGFFSYCTKLFSNLLLFVLEYIEKYIVLLYMKL